MGKWCQAQALAALAFGYLKKPLYGVHSALLQGHCHVVISNLSLCRVGFAWGLLFALKLYLKINVFL